MEVILRKDVRGLGRANEVKNVAEGYAHNFLVPKGLVEIATPEKLARLEAKRVGEAEAIRKIDEELDAKVAQVRGKTITLRLKATEKGGLFKAVAAKDVAKHIASDLGINIPEENITLATAVKTVGEHVAQVHSKNQKGDVAVVVEAEA